MYLKVFLFLYYIYSMISVDDFRSFNKHRRWITSEVYSGHAEFIFTLYINSAFVF
ncbi:hypothetical protein SRABI126_05070 [Pedobacter sp. Bi126]|nr:hypothetical protein SRABI126_05070 [Pedobacter sp. Bi126]